MNSTSNLVLCQWRQSVILTRHMGKYAFEQCIFQKAVKKMSYISPSRKQIEAGEHSSRGKSLGKDAAVGRRAGIGSYLAPCCLAGISE